MNEVVLMIVIAGVLAFSLFAMTRIKKPILHYVMILLSIVLLLLVWVITPETSLGVKLILTAVMLYNIIKEIILINKSKKIVQ